MDTEDARYLCVGSGRLFAQLHSEMLLDATRVAHAVSLWDIKRTLVSMSEESKFTHLSSNQQKRLLVSTCHLPCLFATQWIESAIIASLFSHRHLQTHQIGAPVIKSSTSLAAILPHGSPKRSDDDYPRRIHSSSFISPNNSLQCTCEIALALLPIPVP